MTLSFKIFSWILLATIVGVFSAAANTNLINNYLPENIFTSGVVNTDESPNNNPLPINEESSAASLNTHLSKPINTPASNTSVFKNTIDNITFDTNLLGNRLLTKSTSTRSFVGIDGTGGTEPIPNTGIDGTGGTQPIPNTGIDGTGGTQPIPNKDIPDTDPNIFPPEDTFPPEPSIIAWGTLQRLDNQFSVNGTQFTINDSTKIVINGNTDDDTTALQSGVIVFILGHLNEPTTGSSEEPTIDNVDEPTNGNGNAPTSDSVEESSNATATQIIYTTQISGTITQVSEDSVIVLGQTIILHEDIIFNDPALPDLQVGDITLKGMTLFDLQEGDIVNVSGFKLSDDTLSATRIDRIDSNSDQLSGFVSQLNEIEKTFLVNQLMVKYDQITTPLVLSNGMAVDIKGVINIPEVPILDASSIVASTSILNRDAIHVDIEGFITKFTSESKFKIGEIDISTNLQTQFIGYGPDDLELNTKIQIEGYLDRNNKLIAKKVNLLVANFKKHNNKSTLSGTEETFKWTDVNADAYRLRVLYTNGHGVLYDKVFDGDVTSAIVKGLPENDPYFRVMLYTLHGEHWSRKIFFFHGSGIVPNPELISHSYGDVLQSTTETFIWNSVPGVKSYRLRLFDYPTNVNYYEKTFTKPEAVTVSNLPSNGADISVRLYSIRDDGWEAMSHHNVTSVSSPETKNAVITSHANRETLTGSTETFTWEDVGAEAYEFRVAMRRPDSSFKTLQLYTYDSSTTSATINNLPINSSEVLIRLRTKHSGWATKYYTFNGAPTVPKAELISHSNKGILSSTTETFSWAEVPEAEAYHLNIQNPGFDSTPRFFEDFDSFITSQTISDLPKNSATLRVTLSTKHNGYWATAVYKLTGSGEIPDAEITSHASYEKITTPSTTITWSDVDAAGYTLTIRDLSTNQRVKIHDEIYGPDITSVEINDLPKNTKLLIGLRTKHGKWWASKDLTVLTEIP
jgi:hypothetical protein